MVEMSENLEIGVTPVGTESTRDFAVEAHERRIYAIEGRQVDLVERVASTETSLEVIGSQLESMAVKFDELPELIGHHVALSMQPISTQMGQVVNQMARCLPIIQELEFKEMTRDKELERRQKSRLALKTAVLTVLAAVLGAFIKGVIDGRVF